MPGGGFNISGQSYFAALLYNISFCSMSLTNYQDGKLYTVANITQFLIF